ncbi:hypothetical protein OG875_15620 [Streptomyces sp. NBC_01498]|uniref:hypothetical protein n=1 Tax=Streptomyces sp. NBC_01498 TaxID=2975870 RepID=UPI002E7BABFD|nr:hypothetical protein [Streptomyces sp. NBC_01498]WTL25906.1 hypothetical protein OG875_15620 [Streptomyces sp. NBC_01498]
MRVRRKAAAAIASVAMAGGGLVATAPAASAAPAGATALPSCVRASHYNVPGGFNTSITNGCNYTVRVRVIVDWGGDSDCYVMGARTSTVHQWIGVTGTFNSIASC